MRILYMLGLGLVLVLALLACMPVQPLTPMPSAEESAPITAAVTLTATETVTATATITETVAPTVTPTITSTVAPTVTPPITSTVAPTATPPITSTVVPTVTPPITATVVPTVTPPLTATSVPTATVVPTSQPPEETPTVVPPPETSATPLPTDSPPTTPTAPATATPAPTATFTPGPPPTATPLPVGLFPRNHRLFRDGADLVVVGEIVNGGPAAVYGAKVIVTFFDAGDRLVGAQESMAILPQTLPTQANPFKVRLPAAPSTVTRYELALTWGDLSVVNYDRATITREEVSQEDGLRIFGDVRNDHLMELRGLVVVATLYDEAGLVVDALTGSAGVTTLEPGASTTFEITYGLPVTYTSYLVQVEGMMLR